MKILLFGPLADAVGTSTLEVRLSKPLSVADLLFEVGGQHPGLLPLLSRCVCAVNQKYATRDLNVRETDEVALIPPVSGG
jgi:molybdopterin converting factor subunit 1